MRSNVWDAEDCTLVVAGLLLELRICCISMAPLFDVTLLLYSFAIIFCAVI